MQNFSFLAGLEATEKFVLVVVGGGWFQVTTVSNFNPRLELILAELGLCFDQSFKGVSRKIKTCFN